jgi:hypothetical protein
MGMGLGKFKSHDEAAKELISITGGSPHAIITIITLCDVKNMDLSDALQFVKDRGLPEKETERHKWWQENMDKIRGHVEMVGGEFE